MAAQGPPLNGIRSGAGNSIYCLLLNCCTLYALYAYRPNRYLSIMSLNTELADLFAQFAAIMEIKGESAFKAIAFSKVGRILKDMTLRYPQGCARRASSTEIEGIGKIELRRSSRSMSEPAAARISTKLRRACRRGCCRCWRFRGWGRRRSRCSGNSAASPTWKNSSRRSIAGALAGLKGIGEKKIESIKQGIALRVAGGAADGDRRGAADRARRWSSGFGSMKRSKQAEIAGSLRRRRETIGDVDLICSLNARGIGADGVGGVRRSSRKCSASLGRGRPRPAC